MALNSLSLAPAGEWFKSSYSGDSGNNCVEVAALTERGTIATRDSKQNNGPAFESTPTAWSTFVAGVTDGAFSA
ncbi:DUF397 domain-containing protein [Streptomyces gardneri]|uniref:DUF397 domain-containing protein n=1 Tax=Streptomyces gardneri TaxID=66892 RepID=A0A4Y3RIE4_9ACTN|nr:DUF397 domain-containing protein [Streptomyces gardneri]GEB57139.1 hypothetical protein SGA01_27440 [Streptomyces gardneri]GHH16354.1 hypothetical protein GCM10017674_66180 [Streptomyces gardneri]